MKTVGTFDEARDLAVGRVGRVPTMGFLHEGHLSRVAAARSENESGGVSSCVNPLQFDDARAGPDHPADGQQQR